VVLYLVAEVVASGLELDAVAVSIAALAFVLSTTAGWLLRRKDDPQSGVRRVALLGALAGVALVRWVRPDLLSLVLDLSAAVALPGVGVTAVHLAATTPDRPGPLGRRRRAPSVLLAMGAVTATLAGALAAGPSFAIGSWLVLVPASWAYAPAAFLGLALLVALALRVARRRLGSTPEALASGSWAQLGVAAALVAGGVAAWRTTVHPAEGTTGLFVGAGLAALLAGHVGMLGARRQVHAGRSTRRLLSAAVSIGSIAVAAHLLADRLPRDPLALGVAAGLTLGVGAVLHRVVSSFFDRALAPYRGKLLAAVQRTLESAVAVTTFEELGAAVLPALRRASGALDAEPLLVTLDPPRQVRVDAAGVAHVSEGEASPAILEHVRPRPGEIVVRAPLVEQVVRRPDLRGVVDALDRADALCVVPLSHDLELEGLLVVPRGRRRGAITLEEIDALERLGRHVSAQVALLCASERARRRTGQAVAERDALEEELEAVQEELARVRADARVLKAGGAPARFAPPLIAYSAAMRALMKRLDEVAPLDAPLLLQGEDGTALDQVGHHVHASGARREGPFVVAECAAVRPERADAALFGESAEGRPGWLRLAEGGTCLLLDVPALSLGAQAKLAEAIATRRTSPADGAASHPLDVRIVATSRVPLGPLVEAGLFDAELHRRLEPLTLEVPPLRERREDVPSLVLLALDRSCRTAGRPVLGIDADALEALVAHPWPGNLRELASVIDRAVERAVGPTVSRAALPALTAVEPEETGDPWAGTFAELELRILEHALERAQGNKSEAARLLGLKRSTFLDKLKRYESEGKKHGAEGTAA
jgi:two-component system response regulator HydG